MAGADFFVSFDSDSDKFLAKINGDLKAAETVIDSFDRRIRSMSGFAEGLTRQLQTLKDLGIKIDVVATPPAGGGGGGGHDDVRRIDASIDKFTGAMGGFEKVLGDLSNWATKLPTIIDDSARRSVAAHARERQERGRFAPETEDAARRETARAASTAPPTTRLGAAARRRQQQEEAAERRAGLTSARPTPTPAAPTVPQNIPLVSEAAFEGLKTAVGEGTKATKNVRKSVDDVKLVIASLREALLERPKGGGAPPAGGAPAGGAAPTAGGAAAPTGGAAAPAARATVAAAPRTAPAIIGETGVTRRVARLMADIDALTDIATKAMQPGGDAASAPALLAELEKLRARLAKAKQTPQERNVARGAAREVNRRSALTTPTPSLDFINIQGAMDIVSEQAAGGPGEFRASLLKRKGSKGAAEDPWGTLRGMITSFQKAGVDPGTALSGDLQKKWNQVFDSATGQFRDEVKGKGGGGNTKENLMAIVEGLGRLVNQHGLPQAEGLDAAQKELAKRVNQYKKEAVTVLDPQMTDLVKALGTGEMTPEQKAAFDVLDRNARRGGSSKRGVSALQLERPTLAVDATKARDEFESASKEAEAALQSLNAVKATKRQPDEKEQAALAQAEQRLADVLERERKYRTKELGEELAVARQHLAQVKQGIETATGPAADDVEAANKRYAEAVARRTKAMQAQERIGLARQDQRYVAQAAQTVGTFLDDTVQRALNLGKTTMQTGAGRLSDPSVNPYRRVLGDDENALAANRALAKMRSVYDFLDQYATLMVHAEQLRVRGKTAEAEAVEGMAAPYRVEGVNDDWRRADFAAIKARAQGRAEFAARHDSVQQGRQQRQDLMGAVTDLFLQPLGYQGAARQPMSSAMPGLRLSGEGRLELRDEFAPLVRSAAERNAAAEATRYGKAAPDAGDVRKAERQLTAGLNKARTNLVNFIDTKKEPKLPEKLVEALTKFTGVAQKISTGAGLEQDEEALVKSLGRVTGLNLRQTVADQGPLAASEQVQQSVKMRHLESELYAEYDKLFGTAGGIGIRQPGELGFLSPTTQEEVGGHRMLVGAPAMSEERRQAVKEQEKVLRERANEELKRRRSLGLENPKTLAELEKVGQEDLLRAQTERVRDEKTGAVSDVPVQGQVTGAAAVKRMSDRLRQYGVIFDKKINPTLLAASLQGVDELYREFDRLRQTGELVVSAIRDDLNRAKRQPQREAGVQVSAQGAQQQAAAQAVDPRADFDKRMEALKERQRAAALATPDPTSPTLRQARASQAKLSRLSRPELTRGIFEAEAAMRKDVATRVAALDDLQRKLDADEARIAAMPENKHRRQRRSAERGLKRKQDVMARMVEDLKVAQEDHALRKAVMDQHLDDYFDTRTEAAFYSELAKEEGAKPRQKAPGGGAMPPTPGEHELANLKLKQKVAESNLRYLRADAGEPGLKEIERARAAAAAATTPEEIHGPLNLAHQQAVATRTAAVGGVRGAIRTGDLEQYKAARTELRAAIAAAQQAKVEMDRAAARPEPKERLRAYGTTGALEAAIAKQQRAQAAIPAAEKALEATGVDLQTFYKTFGGGGEKPKEDLTAVRQTPEYAEAQKQLQDERRVLEAQQQESRTIHGPTTVGTLAEAREAQGKYKAGVAEAQKEEEKAATSTKKATEATRAKATATDKATASSEKATKATKEENKALAELLRNAKVASTGEAWKAATAARAAGKTDAEIIAAAKGAVAAAPVKAPSVAAQARTDVTAANKEVRAATKEVTAAEEAKDAARLSAAQKRLTAATEKQAQAKEREAALPKGAERERIRLQGLEADALRRSVTASQKRLTTLGITDVAGERTAIEASLQALPTPSREVKLTAEQAAERKRLNSRLNAIRQVELGEAVAAERGIDLSVAPTPRKRAPRATRPAAEAAAVPAAPAPPAGGGGARTAAAAVSAAGRRLDTDDDVAAIDRVTAAINKVYALLRQGIKTTAAPAKEPKETSAAPAARTAAQTKARTAVTTAEQELAAAKREQDAARSAMGVNSRLFDRSFAASLQNQERVKAGKPESAVSPMLGEASGRAATPQAEAARQKRLAAAEARYIAAMEALAKAKEQELAAGGAGKPPKPPATAAAGMGQPGWHEDLGRIDDESKKSVKERQPAYTPAHRLDLIQGLDQARKGMADEAREAIKAGSADRALAVSVEAVAKGSLNAKEASRLFADEMKLTAKAARDLEKDISRQVAGQRALERQGRPGQTAADRAAREQKKQQAQAAAAAIRQKEKDDEAERKRLLSQQHADVRLAESGAISQATISIGRNIGRDQGMVPDREITQRIQALYRQVDAEGRKAGMTTRGVQEHFKDILTVSDISIPGREVTNLSRSAATAKQMEQAHKGPAKQAGHAVGGYFAGSLVEGLQGDAARSLFGAHGFWSRVVNSAGLFLVRNFAAGMVFGLTNALQQVIVQASEAEATFVRVSSTLEATGRSAGGLRTELLKISTQYGVSLTDVYETAANLAGVFDSVQDIEAATRISVQLQMISNGALNAKEAFTSLSSVAAAFGTYAPAQMEHLSDSMVAIQDHLGTNIEITAEGIAAFAGQAVALNLELEQAEVYVSAIAKTTGATGATAGEQFGRILAAMQGGHGQTSLIEAFGTLPGDEGAMMERALQAREYGKALELLMANYQNLGNAEQDQVAVALGGQKNQRSFQALLLDGNKVLNTITAAQNAYGNSSERAAGIANKLTLLISRLGTAFQGLGAELIRSGALDFLGASLSVIVNVLEKVGTAISKVNDIIEAVPFADTIRHWIAAIVGLGVAMRVLRGITVSLLGSMGQMNKFVLGQAARQGLIPSPIVGAMSARGLAVGGAAGGAAAGGAAAAGGLVPSRYDRRMMSYVTAAEGGAVRSGILPVAATRYAGRRTEEYRTYTEETGVRRPSVLRQAATIYDERAARASEMRMRATVGSALNTFESGTQRIIQRNEQAGAFLQQAGRTSAATSILGDATGTRQMISRYEETSRRITDRQTAAQQYLRTSGRTSAATGVLADIAESRRQASPLPMGEGAGAAEKGLRRMETRAGLMSKALNKGADAIDFMSKHALGLEIAAIAIGVAISAVIAHNNYLKQSAKETKQYVDDLIAGREYNFAGERTEREPDIGPAASLAAKHTEESEGWMAVGGGVLKAIWKAVNVPVWDAKGAFDEEAQKHWGVIPDALQASLDDAWKGVLSSRPVRGAKKEDVAKWGEDQRKSLDARRTAIIDNPELSPATRDAALVQLEQTEGLVNRIVDSLMGAALGMQKLSIELLKGLIDLNGVLLTIDTAALNQYDQRGVGPKNVESAMKAAAKKAGGALPQRQKDLLLEAATAQDQDTRLAAIRDNAALALDEAAAAYEKELAGGDKEKTEAAWAVFMSALAGRNSAQQAWLDNIVNTADSNAQLAAFAGNYGDAAAEYGKAAGALRNEAAQYDAAGDPAKANALRLQAQQKETAAAQALITGQSAALNAEKANTRNAVRLAQIEIALAQVEVRNALGAEAQAAAAIRLGQAQMALQDVFIAQGEAARQTQAARVPPGNALAQARMARRNAQAAMSDAAIYGRASTQYQSALQQSIQAGWSIIQAERAMTEARISLAQARATAAGDIVKAAQIGVKLAKAQLATAKKLSGGKNSAEVLAARAGLVQAQAALRDTKFQNELDTIDFNKEMGRITGEEAIKALQQMLKATNLTEAQRRQLMLKIKGLQDDIRNQLTGSGFNIPSEIKMPTAYEVRRSLGTDAAREALAGQGGGAVAGGIGGGAGNGDLVTAMQQVREAIQANGAQIVTQNVDIVNQVPTQAIARALVTQVIAELQRQSQSAARNNTSTPRSVP